MGAGPELKKSLTERQLRMIAIGGVIGAGLFVGSGVVIGDTGPGVFITYAMAGVLIIMVMRMLAEMAVASPSTGSFADYSRDALGDWAGFSVGWLYWYFWVIVVGFEAIAGAKIIAYWIPGIPLWLVALVLLVLMTATNLFSVSSFGEFEFWFCRDQGQPTIVLFMILGTAFVFGLWPHKSMDFSNLTAHGGFLPLGAGVLTVGIVTTIFSMVGAEIATIAAAESENPEKAVAKAANSVILRIAIFFVGSVFLVVTILPWDFAATTVRHRSWRAFTEMGIPYADHIMNAVVLTAVLSCLNSGMYTASRMLFVLAAHREAPAQLVAVTKKGVPAVAILTSSVIGFLCIIAAAISPDTVFAFLLNSSGAIILFVYLLICISQIVLRYRNGSEGLKVKMWLFPVLSILTALGILGVLRADVHPARRPLATDPEPAVLGSRLIVLFVLNKMLHLPGADPVVKGARLPRRSRAGWLVLANETANSSELLEELRRIGADNEASYYVMVPASPIETGVAATHGPLDVWEATQKVAQKRLDYTLAALRGSSRRTAHWVTTGRCVHWPTPWTSSTPTRS